VGQLRTHPWPHLLVDDFLASEVLAGSLVEINSETYDYEIEARGSGRIEFSLLKSESLWRAIYSKNTVTLLNSAFTTKVRLNKQNYVQLRRMNDETPDFPIHNDFVTGSETIASFLYLSAGRTRRPAEFIRVRKPAWSLSIHRADPEQVCRLSHEIVALAFRGEGPRLGKAERSRALGRRRGRRSIKMGRRGNARLHAPSRLGARQARSNGSRQAWGAIN
jgi:hypothetical protein